MGRYNNNSGCFLWVIMFFGVVTAPLWLEVLLKIFSWFMAYIDFGIDVLGLEPRSFLLICYGFFLPPLVIILLLFGIVIAIGAFTKPSSKPINNDNKINLEKK